MPAERPNFSKSPPGPSMPRPQKTNRPGTGPAEGGVERRKPQALEHRSADGIPGVSKLKASIRQTKRFLQKEGLEPGLKIQTQRRLESLEADLAKSERRSVEMKNGSKYHMIKFFERQKLLRIIKKQQRRLSDQAESTAAKVKVAEEKLEQARIMLNYVLHFPNTEKYISLFPPAAADQPDEHRRLPSYLDESPAGSSSSLDKSSQRRLELLHEMRRLMLAGKLSKEPEVELAAGEAKERVNIGSELEKGAKRSHPAVAVDTSTKGEDLGKTDGKTEKRDASETSNKTDKKDKKDKKARRAERVEGGDVKTTGGAVAAKAEEAGDDFFEA